jgi:hypothetical protein
MFSHAKSYVLQYILERFCSLASTDCLLASADCSLASTECSFALNKSKGAIVFEIVVLVVNSKRFY